MRAAEAQETHANPGATRILGFRILGTDFQTDTKRSTLQEEGALHADMRKERLHPVAEESGWDNQVARDRGREDWGLNESQMSSSMFISEW